MGCCMQVLTEKYYEFSKNDEERDIRIWEKKLGFFRNTFSAVHGPLLIDEKSIQNLQILKVWLTRNFSDKYYGLLSNPYFIADGKISTRRLMHLLFLSTIHVEVRNSGVVYCDKASYLYNLINFKEEVEANSPIEKTNDDLEKVIDELYTISAIVLCEEYAKSQIGLRDGMIKEMMVYKSRIVSSIIQELYTLKGVESTHLDFIEFNSFFMKNPNVRNIIKMSVLYYWILQKPSSFILRNSRISNFKELSSKAIIISLYIQNLLSLK